MGQAKSLTIVVLGQERDTISINKLHAQQYDPLKIIKDTALSLVTNIASTPMNAAKGTRHILMLQVSAGRAPTPP
jgi:hypothetical protein